jgi:hypothetical protein
MKDEHQARIEALNLALKSGVVQSARIPLAHEYEQYILNGYSGEAKPPAPQAPVEAPGTEGKDPPVRPALKGKRGSGKPGEASEQQAKGTDDPELGRPSTRVTGMSI